jgi:hypothetical protein
MALRNPERARRFAARWLQRYLDDQNVQANYEAAGRRCRERLERLLPNDWSWEGKRVLDMLVANAPPDCGSSS